MEGCYTGADLLQGNTHGYGHSKEHPTEEIEKPCEQESRVEIYRICGGKGGHDWQESA